MSDKVMSDKENERCLDPSSSLCLIRFFSEYFQLLSRSFYIQFYKGVENTVFTWEMGSNVQNLFIFFVCSLSIVCFTSEVWMSECESPPSFPSLKSDEISANDVAILKPFFSVRGFSDMSLSSGIGLLYEAIGLMCNICVD